MLLDGMLYPVPPLPVALQRAGAVRQHAQQEEQGVPARPAHDIGAMTHTLGDAAGSDGPLPVLGCDTTERVATWLTSE